MRNRTNLKHALLCGASLVGLLAAPALAQAPAGDAGGTPETVTVTGSRISTGFNAPTPVTVATYSQLTEAAPDDLADSLNQLPEFAGSTLTNQGGGGNVSAQSNGQDLLSLRNLGTTRTLVLLDGDRLPATNQNGSPDVNILPQNLVSRVDVVTGGASAAYGSDAVAGVVNFVLDTKFEGFKADVHGGMSTYSDMPELNVSGAYGTSFADGRGSIVASAQFYVRGGLGVLDSTSRPWYNLNSGTIPNPTAGALPSVIRIPNLRSSVGSNGGLISSGPLKGTQFLAGGVPAPFNYGTVTGTSFQSGGDGGFPGNGISPNERRGNGFVHGEYDVNDNFNLFAEGLYSQSYTNIDASIIPEVGTGGQFTIFAGNPYIPAATAAAMTAANVTSIPVGRYLSDFPPDVIAFDTTAKRGVIGSKGDLFDNWKYNTSVTYAAVDQTGGQYNLPNLRNVYAAADAVVSNGQIVCRSTLSGLDPGCVPLDVFGVGSATPAAIKYIIGNSVKDLKLTQTIFDYNMTGDLGSFSLGAGPIGIAAGFEYRKETANQTSDAVSQSLLNETGLRGVPSAYASDNGTLTATTTRLGGFQFDNPQPLKGSFNIKEGYGEIGVPVLKDVSFAESLDLNAAVRYADYSQSGGVTTWKYGVNWLIVDDLRLRGTVSQDIRGPNILELFNAQTQTNQNFIYNGVTTQTAVIASGNPALLPEKALTHTYGVVLRPHWIEGLQASVDFYRINITDAIGSLGAQQIINNCAAGLASSCALINNNGGLVIHTPTENLSAQATAGYDFEGDYNTNIFDGSLSLRLLANRLLSFYTIAPGATTRTQGLGSPSTPTWRGTVSAEYAQDNWTIFAQERYIGAAVIDPTMVQGIGLSLNNIPSIFYTDVTAKYRFHVDMLGDQEQEVFFTINNLFNQQPPISGGNPTTYNVPVSFAYDLTGRYFTLGLRVAMP